MFTVRTGKSYVRPFLTFDAPCDVTLVLRVCNVSTNTCRYIIMYMLYVHYACIIIYTRPACSEGSFCRDLVTTFSRRAHT